MFTSIHIKSFRSCHNVVLTDLQSILVLIGRNGAGKTNVMKAISWACQYAGGATDRPTSMRWFRGQGGDVTLNFKLDGMEFRYSLKVDIDPLKAPQKGTEVEESLFVMHGDISERILSRKGENLMLFNGDSGALPVLIAADTPCLPAIHSLLADSHPVKSISERVMRFLAAVKYYPLHNFEEVADNSTIITSDVYRKWKTSKSLHHNSLLSLQCTLIEISEEAPGVLEELNSLIGPSGLKIIDNISIEAHRLSNPASEEAKTYFFWVKFDLPCNTPRVFTIGDLSFGTIRILFLLTAMLYDKASVALLEQPEDGIHMALIKKLIPMLRAYSDDSQFMISSHSAAVMNLTKPTEIRFITNENGNTKARGLSADELESAKDFLDEEGPLGEFLQSMGA
jgi:ABC-type branched-subunit amino acid transport system ATPase component